MRKNDKIQAIALRKRGQTYNKISTQLDVPKSTLSGWLRNVKIPKKTRERMMNKTQQSWIKTITNFNRKRAITIAKFHENKQSLASKEIAPLSLKELKLIGTALYWAEGYKKSRWNLLFVNSDHGMISLMMKFFRRVCQVPENKTRISVQIHPNVSELIAKQYWSKVTGIPVNQFHKTLTSVSRASKGIRSKKTLPYGTCRIGINDVYLVDKVKGWINGLEKEFKI